MANDLFPHLLQPTCAQCVGIGLKIPSLLWDLEDDCGNEVLIAFLRECGGRELTIASRPSEPKDGDLVDKAIFWLRQRFRSGKLVIPLGPTSYQSRLAWTVYIRLIEGASLAAIVKELHCDIRTVCIQKKRLTGLGAYPARPLSLPAPTSTSLHQETTPC